MTKHEKICFFVISIIIYLIFALPSIDKPFTLDEAIPMAENASSIAKSGPGAMGYRYLKDPNNLKHEIAHPLLYHHFLALFFWLFGETTVAGRLMGIFCFVGTLCLIFLICRELFKDRKGSTIGIISIFLYSINPFIIQNSLLLDIDTTILPLTLLFFIYLFLKTNDSYNLKSLFLLSIAFSICLWAKEITPYFLLLSIFFFLCVSLNIKSAAIITSTIAVSGTLIFFLSWLAFCWFTNVPILSFVKFSIMDKAINPNFHAGRINLYSILSSLSFTGRWLTPSLCVLLILSFYKRIISLLRDKNEAIKSDLLRIFFILYWFITAFYMHILTKYQYPLYSIAIIVIAEFIHDTVLKMKKKEIVQLFFACILVASLIALIPHEPLHEKAIKRHEVMQIDSEAQPSIFLSKDDSFRYALYDFLFYTMIPVFLGLMFSIYLSNRNKKGFNMGTLILLFCLISSSLVLDIKQIKNYTTALSWNTLYFGERGFIETINFLKANVHNSIPVVRKDMGYYLNKDINGGKKNWIYNSIFRSKKNKKEAIYMINDPKIKFVVIDIFCNPKNAMEVLSREFRLIKIYGDFKIYKKIEK